jgi:hypothetical protein
MIWDRTEPVEVASCATIAPAAAARRRGIRADLIEFPKREIMLGFLVAVPRFGVQATRQRVLECLLRAEMYLVDTIIHSSAGKHDAVRGFAAFLGAEVRQAARRSSSPDSHPLFSLPPGTWPRHTA